MDTDLQTEIGLQYDQAIEIVADYTAHYEPSSLDTYGTAAACLADALGCAILALQFPACTRLLGPSVPGITSTQGVKIPGTSYILDPVTAAFNIGTLIRWLDYNDTWLASEWAHPSDNLGGLLALADYLDRNGTPQTVRDLCTSMIQAYEIQGCFALENSFNQIGFDHVILVKIATAAVCTKLLGGSKEQIAAAVSQGWIDLGPLRTYRRAPNTGSRKSWAAGDATKRGLELALLTMRGEPGYLTPLSAKKWGLYDVLFSGRPFRLPRPLGHYVMDHILFKIAYPAEFHAQTAAECAIRLHPQVQQRWEEIKTILIRTNGPAVRIIDKKGPLKNPADRDHCLQYIAAIGLLFGDLKAMHYEDAIAQDPRIDRLRSKMIVEEDPQYSEEYLDPDKRSIANALTIYMEDGAVLGPVEIHYPLGHKKRRMEGMPLLMEKFHQNVRTQFPAKKADEIAALFRDTEGLMKTRVSRLMDLLHAAGIQSPETTKNKIYPRS